jgi:HTH-type transcriptional regulator/antitoxin HigA
MSAIVEANGRGAKRIDGKKYGRLLARVLPSVIETEKENERMLAEVEKLIDKPKLSAEEEKLLDLMVRLIEDFEEEAYPMDDVPPHEMLKFLMEQRELRQRDLIDIFGSSGRVSEMVNGKRQITKTQAKALGKFFHIPAELFL